MKTSGNGSGAHLRTERRISPPGAGHIYSSGSGSDLLKQEPLIFISHHLFELFSYLEFVPVEFIKEAEVLRILIWIAECNVRSCPSEFGPPSLVPDLFFEYSSISLLVLSLLPLRLTVLAIHSAHNIR